jgi:branched-chain amino acid transport system substrate-binding protein
MSAEKEGHGVITEYLEEQGTDPETIGTSWVQGWYVMHVMAEGMRAAIADGAEELDGPAIREALETMGPIDTGGVVGDGTVEFSAESHRGSVGTGVYTAEGGQMVEVEAGATP